MLQRLLCRAFLRPVVPDRPDKAVPAGREECLAAGGAHRADHPAGLPAAHPHAGCGLCLAAVAQLATAVCSAEAFLSGHTACCCLWPGLMQPLIALGLHQQSALNVT